MTYKVTYKINEKYEIKKLLGQGNFGQVYLVHNKILNKERVIKIVQVIDADTFQEAQIGNIITHKNLVKIHSAEYNQDLQHLIIEMDYCEKGSIESKLNANGYLPLKKAIKYTIELLRGLEALHGNSIFHNDIKPKNILISSDDRAMLTDYGIAMMSSDKQPINPQKGFYKLHYAPESFETACINISTDIYQVGLTLFRIINGVEVLPTKFYQIGEESYFELVKSGKLITKNDYLDFVPRQIKMIINKAISPDIKKRYQTAREMRHSLEQLIISGDWNLDSNGILYGEDNRFKYTFDIETKQNKYNFKAYKINKKSNIKTQIHKYDKKNIDIKSLNAHKKNFMQDVVTGNI